MISQHTRVNTHTTVEGQIVNEATNTADNHDSDEDDDNGRRTPHAPPSHDDDDDDDDDDDAVAKIHFSFMRVNYLDETVLFK